MNKGKLSAVATSCALALVSGCNEGIDPNVAAGTAIGAGIGMAVSGDDDKVAGALVGGGLGTILASAIVSQTGDSQSGSSAQQQSNYSDGLSDTRTQQVVSAHDFAIQTALESNSPSRWASRGASGTIYPTSTFMEYGLRCRSFDSIWQDGGNSGKLSGRACRQPNGFWKRDNI